MQTERERPIPIDKELNNFKQFLDAQTRCIFSARFGDGKSYFLSEFITKNKNEYLFIPIYPVNYQVSDNKDIFEYIKRDILIRLLSVDGVEIEDDKINGYLKLWGFVTNNKLTLLEDICGALPDINIAGINWGLGKIVTAVKKISDRFEEYNGNIDKLNQSSQINSFVDTFTTQEGGIYEFDVISRMIYDLITQYKRNNNKKVVLIIEDLDRIDPAHLFRILNIFSAHFDRYNNNLEKGETGAENKFNFDKIVTVCDYNNVSKIFTHFYGNNTDFAGYIHKFSSNKPFEYSLRYQLREFIKRKFPPFMNEFPLILDMVINKILSHHYDNQDQNTKGNLRSIIARLEDVTPVKDKQIRIQGGYFIPSKNNFTELLNICNGFDIGIISSISMMDTEVRIELLRLIVVCYFVNNLLVIKNEIVYINYNGNLESGYLNISIETMKDKIITKLNFSYPPDTPTEVSQSLFNNIIITAIENSFLEKDYIINYPKQGSDRLDSINYLFDITQEQ